MKKTYNLFTKSLITIFTISVVGLIFALFTLIFYYEGATTSIDYKNVVPIFTILIFGVAICASLIFTVKTDKIYISKIKKNSSSSKFATLLAVALSSALFLYDFIAFVIYPSQTSPLKIFRLLVFVPFIAYLIIEVIPSRSRHKRITIPTWLRVITSLCTIAWCIFGLLAIYFWTVLPITNFFKIHHMFYYVLAVLFFLFEIKFELISHKSHRGYMLSALVLFSYTFISTGAIIIAKFAGSLSEVTISDFEMFLPFALGLYAFSKMLAIRSTIKFVMKKESQTIHEHGHHHHHKKVKKVKEESTTVITSNEIEA